MNYKEGKQYELYLDISHSFNFSNRLINNYCVP
ncbi:CRISPR-associated DxTHG motif protein [Bacillus sonorensis]|nr:CRISPR-associated DxTHG motif protein [Bacillus sonorensis]